jgi:transposase
MLTTMTEADWTIVLQVFAASRSRRGDKGRDDRRFLEALHYFVVHNITWRALPEKFGHWNSVWKRFWRLSQSGTFEAFFDALAGMSETAHLAQMFDSTVVRAHVSAAGAKGGRTIKRSAARAAASRRKFTCRSISAACRSPFFSPAAKPATAATSKSCSISDLTSRRAPPSPTKATMPKPIVIARADAASVRSFRTNQTRSTDQCTFRKRSTRHGHASNRRSASSNASNGSRFDARRLQRTSVHSWRSHSPSS